MAVDPAEKHVRISPDATRPATPKMQKSTSLIGQKRGRDQVDDSPASKIVPPRRTKSVGDVNRLSDTERRGLVDDGYKRGMIKEFVKDALCGVSQASPSPPRACLSSYTLPRSSPTHTSFSFPPPLLRFDHDINHQQGNETPYLEFLSHFLPSPTTPIPPLTSLTPLLQALTSNLTLLSSHHSALIRAIIDLPWASAGDEGFVRVYVGFLGVLCSAKAEWVGDVVGMGVKGLSWQTSLKTLPNSPPLPRRTYHHRHLSLISHLLSLIPTLPSILGPALVKNFPFKRENELVMETYVRNILGLVEGCPEVAGRVWEGIMDRLIRLDVEIQIELEDLDEDDVDAAREIPTTASLSTPTGLTGITDPLDRLVSESYNRPDDTDEDSDDSDDEGVDLEDLSSDEESLDGDSNNGAGEPTELDEKRYRRLHVLRSKVDALSTLFLKHLERIFAGKTNTGSQNLSSLSSVAPPSLPFHRSYTNQDNRLAHFQTLLSIFDRLVLPTFQCRRAQFIVFWCCSLDSGYTDLFLGLLVSRALYETTQPAVNRVAAASYIASFVSRAKYIDDDQVRTVVQYLTAYIDGILAEARSDPMAVAASGGLMVFYTVCQAVMMIFCFRWRALQSAVAGEETMADEMEMDDVEGSESAEQGGWMADMDVLQKAVFSQLNPLMACYPIVVDMFAKIAHTTKFMFCYSVITANRSALESTHVAHSISLENLGSSDVTQVLPLIGRQSLSETSLDSFFPFDPYDLPRARTFVETFYRNWDEVAVQTEDEDDEDEFGTSTETETEDDEGGDFPRSQSFSHSSNYIGIVGRAMRTGGNDAHANELSTSLEGISLSQRQLPLGLVA